VRKNSDAPHPAHAPFVVPLRPVHIERGDLVSDSRRGATDQRAQAFVGVAEQRQDWVKIQSARIAVKCSLAAVRPTWWRGSSLREASWPGEGIPLVVEDAGFEVAVVERMQPADAGPWPSCPMKPALPS